MNLKISLDSLIKNMKEHRWVYVADAVASICTLVGVSYVLSHDAGTGEYWSDVLKNITDNPSYLGRFISMFGTVGLGYFLGKCIAVRKVIGYPKTKD